MEKCSVARKSVCNTCLPFALIFAVVYDDFLTSDERSMTPKELYLEGVRLQCLNGLQRGAYKRVRIVVCDGCVRVTAPRTTPMSSILAFIDKNLDKIGQWLKSQQQSQDNPWRPVYADGGCVAYRGRMLKIRLAPEARETGLEAGQDVLCVRLTPLASEEDVRQVVQEWLKAQFKALTQSRLAYWIAQTGLNPSLWRPSSALTRWGCCTSKGSLRINWRSISLPPEAYDYILVHELCHLKHFNHSAAFWALVRGFCPDADASRAFLKQISLRRIY